MTSEIVDNVARMTGLQPIVVGGIVQLVGEFIAAEIMAELFDPEWPTDRESVAVEAAANIARHAHVDPAI